MSPELLPSDGVNHLIDEDGFWFMPENETAGRLDVASYGNTFVSEGWVSKHIEDHRLGELVGYSAKGLAGWQDVYMIRKPAKVDPPAQVPTPPAGSTGC